MHTQTNHGALIPLAPQKLADTKPAPALTPEEIATVKVLSQTVWLLNKLLVTSHMANKGGVKDKIHYYHIRQRCLEWVKQFPVP